MINVLHYTNTVIKSPHQTGPYPSHLGAGVEVGDGDGGQEVGGKGQGGSEYDKKSVFFFSVLVFLHFMR